MSKHTEVVNRRADHLPTTRRQKGKKPNLGYSGVRRGLVEKIPPDARHAYIGLECSMLA